MASSTVVSVKYRRRWKNGSIDLIDLSEEDGWMREEQKWSSLSRLVC
jgi:hypothetical protein